MTTGRRRMWGRRPYGSAAVQLPPPTRTGREGNGDCLEVADAGTGAGAGVRLGTCSGGKHTRWQVELADPVRKLYQLRPTHIANRCLDIPNSEVAQGKPLRQWTCNQTDAQLWRIKPLAWPA
ncbi:RICIN domain-containing protein [Streptomyces californicus]|uniref:RICIN domain-containing protein n=1 Tax=Streptomyces californicus TaxID=67351 RepID=UPI003799835D